MITAPAGGSFVALTDAFPAGLVGTLSIQIETLAGATVSGPTTGGITEIEPAVYSATGTAPATPLGEYALVWKNGSTRVVEALVVTSSSRDAVRRKIGDQNPSDQLLADADIDAALANWPGNTDLAAAECAEAIAAKFSRDYSFQTAETQQFSRRERVENYMKLAEELRDRGGQIVWPNRVTVNP